MKKRILAIVLVLALFVAVFSVSALAAFDQKGTAEVKGQKSPPPVRVFYWIDEVNQVGCYRKNPYFPYTPNYGLPHDHLTEWWSGNWDPVTYTMTYYGTGLHDTNGVVVFGWASPNVPNER